MELGFTAEKVYDPARHVKPLLRKSPIYLKLLASDSEDVMYVEINQAGIHQKKFVPDVDVILIGIEEDLMDIFKGEVKLQDGVNHKRVKAEGTIHNLLRLESILWLLKK
ncbi:SCP2 sterol-binding domain-containing protein [Metabacillus sp. RGM 3146]|uniref:SCP2 sterol-binding domain-containing protein n=1 Tax=Metabacillus sp. RGM 3146 TaxID=3401092 RepID=UPI003B9D0F87